MLGPSEQLLRTDGGGRMVGKGDGSVEGGREKMDGVIKPGFLFARKRGQVWIKSVEKECSCNQ